MKPWRTIAVGRYAIMVIDEVEVLRLESKTEREAIAMAYAMLKGAQAMRTAILATKKDGT